MWVLAEAAFPGDVLGDSRQAGREKAPASEGDAPQSSPAAIAATRAR